MFSDLRRKIYRVRSWLYRHYTPKIRRYYNQSVGRHGNDILALGWRSHYSQFARFEQLLLHFSPQSSDTLLDIGCGFGDLLTYLKEENVGVAYTGIDVSSKMIDQARKNHPNTPFMEADFFIGEWPQFDFVVASGVLSLHTQDQYYYLDAAIQRMLSLAKKGVAFNLLSDQAPKREQGNPLFFYYSPAKVWEIATKYCQKLIVSHHYLPNDFTIVLLKQPDSKP